ncbi:constitutive coactivator of PPAR-gamma-like protein 1 homolog [Ischnura elegans]|uniref:constitutive coactivator of PPAR-gamma-like protein 1 homolog n=1 Tax=Ischnura elegans TaxID=197161 RepID=UPI001ED8AB63|nr:constitutive coactivator of PPAR-gamma-like protein 1 homolog [Ischnura elegans]XP_046396594.1 constitutive coactivator of PPAR-gamma-like protein 1 homolog [Ischnura elegans]XP_046396603.1 constitutive coactivator of PPAR-gamma-like protein 1 homolog [Ischnura elegans]XP_046396610.1 constitutive coactivator of PPAR-gamma-like protein 1 homolog [Ischnura elegans]XP_046396620.1 constitutive coactivator of PPAR-gamma-like protein 1 homolog [Ischnura elegans]
MGIQDLQIYLETQVPGACVQVDILKIARSIASHQQQRRGQGRGNPPGVPPNGPKVPPSPSKLCLVVDGECCLDRLYGGYFSDWACGGQWNRMVQFLAVLIQTIQTSNVELAVFFNGSLEPQRMNEWIAAQQAVRRNVNQVLKHINTKGTPPPKIWWVPPVCLRTCLRMALRHLSVSVVCSMDDHHQEVIAYCRENHFHGLMAEDAEYAVFDPPRYFSSEQIKLTYKGCLETKEYMLSELAKGLELSPNRFCILAALLGNYMLTEEELMEFYRTLCPDRPQGKIPAEILVKNVATFVSSLPTVDNLDLIATKVFGSATDKRVAKFKQSVQYYQNGTQEGFLRYKPSSTTGRRQDPVHIIPNKGQQIISKVKPTAEDTSRFASETMESEQESLAAYKEATAGAVTPQIVIDGPKGQTNPEVAANGTEANKNHVGGEEEEGKFSAQDSNAAKPSGPTSAVNGNQSSLLLSSSSSSSSSNAASPSRLTPDVTVWNAQSGSGKGDAGVATAAPHNLPAIPPEVMRTASERHQKGLMSPYIYQILTRGEIKLPVVMEDENHKELPSIHLFYRPVRQMIYAILFNLHHYTFLATKNKEKGESEKVEIPEVSVKEWLWSKGNEFQRPDIVKAEQVGWGVPTIQRLWFGSAIDDKRRRLRAFLTCMRSDTPLMLNPTYVPQHLLVIACVLRYIMSFPEKRVLRKPELDVFIAQAFSPELMNAHYLQELQLPLVTGRGVQLASLLMQGVEVALMANDACGAPIPWLMCCPWLFFDGKLFHHKLARAATVKNLLELCDHRIDQVMKVERMRKAILEDITPQFARPPHPPMPAGLRMAGLPANSLPAGASMPGGVGHHPPHHNGGVVGSGRGLVGRRSVLARGGQLEIAGVVVGSWGPNFGSGGGGNSNAVGGGGNNMGAPIGHHRGGGGPPRPLAVAPQVTSVGGLKNFRAPAGYPIGVGLRSAPFQSRGGKTARGRRPQVLGKRRGGSAPKKFAARGDGNAVVSNSDQRGVGSNATAADSPVIVKTGLNAAGPATVDGNSTLGGHESSGNRSREGVAEVGSVDAADQGQLAHGGQFEDAEHQCHSSLSNVPGVSATVTVSPTGASGESVCQNDMAAVPPPSVVNSMASL